MAERWDDGAIAALAASTGVEVDVSEPARTSASGDFGGLLRGRAFGVARPSSTRQLQEVVRFANARDLRLTARGGGMSQSGQSVPRDGLSLDLRRLDTLDGSDGDGPSIACGPGVTFRALTARLWPSGRTPYVVPLNLDLSVGGVLSAGGFGSTSHRFGPAASHVRSVEVVTGGGEIVGCGPDRERAVYDAVVGGVGRCGIIAGVEIALRRVPRFVRTFYLMYDELAAVLDDLRALAEPGRANHVEAFCSATVQGLRKNAVGRRQPFASWSYGVQVSVEHDGEPPDAGAVLAGLRPTRRVHVEDDDAPTFAARYDVRFEAMRATGAWEQLHPWLECVLPWSAAAEVIPRVLEVLPLFLGDGHRLSWIADHDRPASLSFPDDKPWVTFSVLPMGVPRALREPALRALETAHRLLLAAHGKRYLSGWLFEMDAAAWRAHHGARHESLLQTHRALDPHGVLDSCLLSSGDVRT